MTIISTVPMRSERRFALPAQNDLHSVENFFTLDEETYFLYIYSPRTNEKFATSCSYIYFSHEPQWPRSFPPVVSLAPQCPRMAKRVPLRTRPRVIHVEIESVGSLGNSISPTNNINYQYVIAVMQTTCRWDCGHS